jgi:hypothetical protein
LVSKAQLWESTPEEVQTEAPPGQYAIAKTATKKFDYAGESRKVEDIVSTRLSSLASLQGIGRIYNLCHSHLRKERVLQSARSSFEEENKSKWWDKL